MSTSNVPVATHAHLCQVLRTGLRNTDFDGGGRSSSDASGATQRPGCARLGSPTLACTIVTKRSERMLLETSPIFAYFVRDNFENLVSFSAGVLFSVLIGVLLYFVANRDS